MKVLATIQRKMFMRWHSRRYHAEKLMKVLDTIHRKMFTVDPSSPSCLYTLYHQYKRFRRFIYIFGYITSSQAVKLGIHEKHCSRQQNSEQQCNSQNLFIINDSSKLERRLNPSF
jgi:hypothetical protein